VISQHVVTPQQATMEPSVEAHSSSPFSSHPGIAVFERNAERYDRWFENHGPTFAAELLALRQLLPPFQRGLEIGVGTGRFSLPLGITEGVEPAEAMAAIAERRGLAVSRAVAEDLPYPDGSFDLALMVTVLCFLDAPRRALREAHRILKPGGSILIGMIDPASSLGREYEANKATSTFYAPARFHAVEQVIAWLRECGFTRVCCRQAVLPGFGAGPFIAVRAKA
jgi:SAM-dependent methyltransferase